MVNVQIGIIFFGASLVKPMTEFSFRMLFDVRLDLIPVSSVISHLFTV